MLDRSWFEGRGAQVNLQPLRVPPPRRCHRHPPAVHHRRPHGLLHALRLADGGAATAALLQLLCWCRMLLLLALHLSCSGRSAVSGLIC